MPKSKPPRKKRRVLGNRERIRFYVRRCDRAGLDDLIVRMAFAPENRDDLERIIREEVESAAAIDPLAKAYWVDDPCDCGASGPHSHMHEVPVPGYEFPLLLNDAQYAEYERLKAAEGGDIISPAPQSQG
jgi:hypothetical protein